MSISRCDDLLLRKLSLPLASSIPTPTKEWTFPKLESRCESALASIEGVKPEMMSRFEVIVSSAIQEEDDVTKIDDQTSGNVSPEDEPKKGDSLSQATNRPLMRSFDQLFTFSPFLPTTTTCLPQNLSLLPPCEFC